jgi:hypothetical protein
VCAAVYEVARGLAADLLRRVTGDDAAVRYGGAHDALMQCGKTAAVMTVYMDRPAILTNVKDKAAALYADFGVSDASLLDILMGNGQAQAHLPFELPSSTGSRNRPAERPAARLS